MQTITQWIGGRGSLLAIVVVVLGLAGIGVWFVSRPQAAVEPAFASGLSETGLEPEIEQPAPTSVPTIVVYISGAVRAPDVYALPADARVKDLVVAAGGLTEDADPDQINLAEKLTDAQHVQVARRGVNGAPAGTATSQASTKLNVNTASADDLEALPGIGASLAERIITYRTENGPLAQIEDLQNIKGIGGSVYDKIAPLVTVGS